MALQSAETVLSMLLEKGLIPPNTYHITIELGIDRLVRMITKSYPECMTDGVIETLATGSLKITKEARYICFSCAENRGGVWPGYNTPIHIHFCDVCTRERALIDVNNWEWPDSKGVKYEEEA